MRSLEAIKRGLKKEISELEGMISILSTDVERLREELKNWRTLKMLMNGYDRIVIT